MSPLVSPTLAAPTASPLEGIALFASLDPTQLEAVEACCQWQEYGRDEHIFLEGEAPTWLYVIVDGFVKLVKHSDDGRDIILHIAMPGDLIGGVSAFGRRPHPFSAQTMVPTLALRLAGQDYAAIMEAHPQVASQTLDDLIERLTEAHETMKSLAVERVERRIARQLIKLAARAGVETPLGTEIRLLLTRQDVADMAGTTVETAIRVLSRWRRAGLVDTVHAHLVVMDATALMLVAEEGVESGP